MLSRKLHLFILIGGLIFFSFINVNRLIYNDVKCFDVDVFNNVVYVSSDKICLTVKTDNKKYYYQNLTMGTVNCIYFDDALNIMVYYGDMQKILFLDNTLSPKRSPIDLNDLGYSQASLACLSYNTGFWIFDPVSNSLHRFDRFLTENATSGNLNQIIGSEIAPFSMKEKNNLLLINDSLKGIAFFDRYGNYLKLLPFLHVSDFQIYNDNIEFLKNDTLFRYDMNTLKIDTILINPQNIIQFKRTKSQLYFLNKNGDLYISEIKKSY